MTGKVEIRTVTIDDGGNAEKAINAIFARAAQLAPDADVDDLYELAEATAMLIYGPPGMAPEDDD